MKVCELVDYECPECGHAFPVVPGGADERCSQCGRPVSPPQDSGSQPPLAGDAVPRAREA
jgi:DNA-directed RNA polymerase subunit RPC12/RpoP